MKYVPTQALIISSLFVISLILLFLLKKMAIIPAFTNKDGGPPVQKLQLPKNFLFGVATSAFQVEYDPNENVESNWSRFLNNHPQTVAPGETGPSWFIKGRAEEDIDRFASLGIDNLRMGMEWSRIEPKAGEFDLAAIKRYREIINYAIGKGITPMVTVHHFTNPGWFDDLGGWENKQNISFFLEYVKRLVKEFPDIKYWVTVNEPNVYVNNGYIAGAFPPEKFDILKAFKVRNNIINASNQAYQIIKRGLPKAQVGATYNLRLYFPHNDKKFTDRLAASLANYVEAINYIDATAKYSDFIGINYYTAYRIRFSPTSFTLTMREGASGIPETLPLGRTEKPEAIYTSDMGWPISPEAFYATLKLIDDRYNKPIIITENGISDGDDRYRAYYLLTHFAALQKALNNGVDILGYYHWSGIDNLEWAEGYSKKFGLISVDSSNGQRRIRTSSYLYKKIIEERPLDLNEAINTYIKDPQQQTEAKKVINSL